jgi:hypothetical protein
LQPVAAGGPGSDCAPWQAMKIQRQAARRSILITLFLPTKIDLLFVIFGRGNSKVLSAYHLSAKSNIDDGYEMRTYQSLKTAVPV